jgi:peptide/nickel transport system permease protein
MQRYIVTRLFLAIVIAVGVTVVAFASIQLIPADVVDVTLGIRSDPEAAAALRHKLGLDQPPVEQYFRWLARLAHGDLGTSLNTGRPVMETLRQRLPVTLELALLATCVAMGLGVPAGIVAAVKQYSMADKVSTAASMLGLSTPDFWLATLLILVFSVTWRLFPPGGLLPSLWEDPLGNLARMAMPALSIGLPSAAVYFRMMRSSMLEVIRSDYMLTAYSKGLTERRVVLVHALKNAIVPVVTVTGLEMTWMLGGAFIVETIFSLPGLGRSTVQAIYERDYTVLQGCLLVFSLVVVVMSVLVDLVYATLDPRIRYE